MKQSGFTLIETLLYAALLGYLAMVIFSWATHFASAINQAQKKSHNVMAIQTALLRLKADIQGADVAINRWSLDDNSMKLYCGDSAICWCQEKDRLYRIENKTKGLIATHITKFHCSLYATALQAQGIICTMEAGDICVSAQIQVYNG